MMKKAIISLMAICVVGVPPQAMADHYPKAPDNKSTCGANEAGGHNFTGPNGHVHMICEQSRWDGALRWHLGEETSSRAMCYPTNAYRREVECDMPDLSHIEPGTPIYVDESVETLDWTVLWFLNETLEELAQINPVIRW